MSGIVAVPDRLALYEQFPKGGVGAEIGVHVGKNAEALLRIAQPRELHLIDPWVGGTDLYDGIDPGIDGRKALAEVERRFGNAPAVHLHRGLSWDVLERFADGYFDWAYLDASHEERDAFQDLQVLGRKVRGIIAGHDYCEEFPGVMAAVRRFVETGSWRMRFLTVADRWRSFALTPVFGA